MSTSYFKLKFPVTYLRVEEGKGHSRVKVWIDHGLSGILTLRNTELRQVLQLFTQYEADNACPMRTHWGGSERGAIVTENEPGLFDEMLLISEYGELLTVEQIRARDGAKRDDGMPTELFGYEGNA